MVNSRRRCKKTTSGNFRRGTSNVTLIQCNATSDNNSSQHSTYLASNVVRHQRSSSPTLADLLATISDSDSDSDSINAQPNNSTNPIIPNASNIETNQDRPVFSSGTLPYHNPRHLGTLPFYYPESRRPPRSIPIANITPVSRNPIQNPYASPVPTSDLVEDVVEEHLHRINDFINEL